MKLIRRWLGQAQHSEQAASGPTGAVPALRVLMVCMGNICRSPTAEGVLRARLQAAGLGGAVEVDSAGTLGSHAGEPPDPRAVRAAAQRGVDLSRLRARAVEAADFERFDWILAMDEDNLAWLRRKQPAGSRARVELLLAPVSGLVGTAEVPDPYYGPPAGFERVLDLVERGCDGFIARIGAESASRP